MKTKRYVGGWLPDNRAKIATWVNGVIEKVNRQKSQRKSGVNAIQSRGVEQLRQLIYEDPKIRLLAEQMISQALEYDEKDPYGKPQITSVGQMLDIIEYITHTAPEYMQPDAEGRGLIGFPLNAVLNWCMGTQAGYAFFLEERVNACFNNILKEWCDFLSSPASCYVLNDSETGWLCDAAKKELELDKFIIKPELEHYGFTSWNDFFTRQFKEGVRPLECGDDDYVITNACESAPYRIATNVQKNTCFWLKSQPYSLEYMLDKCEYVDEFLGGTVYQAFLSAARYHRWHSPVSGTIKMVRNVPGTYYAEVNSYPYDEAGPNESQGYITHVAARAIIIIEADNKDIGLVGVMPVGMSEVSSCVVSVQEGQHVNKGDEIGYFQFGGSTHCLIFQKDVIEQFVVGAIPAEDFNDSTLQKVRSKLATVRKNTKKKDSICVRV